MKYIAWQLAVSLFWMHRDMHTAHLDLTTDNVMLQHCRFEVDPQTNAVTIDTSKLTAKICDFGFAEVFAFPNGDDDSDEDEEEASMFACSKSGLTKDHMHKAPKAYNGETYDARATDMFAFGVIMFWMFFGRAPFDYVDDDGYEALREGALGEYLEGQGLSHFARKAALRMMGGLLELEEAKRMSIGEVLNDEWFKNYYARYKRRIQQKSKSQRERHLRQQRQMQSLPYYKLRKQ